MGDMYQFLLELPKEVREKIMKKHGITDKMLNDYINAQTNTKTQ